MLYGLILLLSVFPSGAHSLSLSDRSLSPFAFQEEAVSAPLLSAVSHPFAPQALPLVLHSVHDPELIFYVDPGPYGYIIADEPNKFHSPHFFELLDKWKPLLVQAFAWALGKNPEDAEQVMKSFSFHFYEDLRHASYYIPHSQEMSFLYAGRFYKDVRLFRSPLLLLFLDVPHGLSQAMLADKSPFIQMTVALFRDVKRLRSVFGHSHTSASAFRDLNYSLNGSAASIFKIGKRLPTFGELLDNLEELTDTSTPRDSSLHDFLKPLLRVATLSDAALSERVVTFISRKTIRSTNWSVVSAELQAYSTLIEARIHEGRRIFPPSQSTALSTMNFPFASYRSA